jgi:hypothetical protein
MEINRAGQNKDGRLSEEMLDTNDENKKARKDIK